MHARSRVTNGKEYLPGIDGRTLVARRMRDIAGLIAFDLGGADRMSEIKAQLVRRFAGASALAEQLEARIARGETVDIAEHAALTSSLVRIANKVGITRAMKKVPTLDEYLAGKSAEVSDDE
jgi:hypothetical protein